MTTHSTTSTNARPSARGTRLVVAGAPLDNDNRGVEALGTSVVAHLASAASVDSVSVLGDGWGVSADSSWPGDARVDRLGVRNSRRWHRRESWARIRVDRALGGLGNPVVARLGAADAVLDISGGDSFTDLYGPRRLATICAPKEAAVRSGRPLVLLPQTFGPFTTAEGRRRAEGLVRHSALAYARDAWSHEQLLDLAGPSADATRLREGVDVAFALPAREPAASVVEQLDSLTGEVVVGVNVSGLLREESAVARFGLAGPYLATMTSLVRELVRAGAVVVLVSHVHGVGRSESDDTAHGAVLDALDAVERTRVHRLSPLLRAAELKWCIGRLDWFAGSRMHATIAALSSQVPAFGYAYSDKTRGVFGTCAVAEDVVDARAVAGQEAVEQALASFARRDATREVLRRRVPDVVAQARGQLDDVLGAVSSWRDGSAGTVA
ncbi:Polysaccharide pyruvyl transferase family protein WcaK [Georgenia satyanarayanai]|uniref:Polysaccharide pyruvyl transferase family protein WcaK n=1 Tax=Georgenia satyanarayanai TaxID=860221 RepID=A0A2Y9AF07_9MICO|nr:polysaccharide pyruvyl transferase family protein [Georgenia satyanarayanai]PYF99671.1 polysaccharide pyruvyl transferase WcaK-like protein [Georgenia satyanarayanai]SSA42516.1 Polysaccharide pyruvyl transferase family protein WcaK [Georgenia satyanarayanai]